MNSETFVTLLGKPFAKFDRTKVMSESGSSDRMSGPSQDLPGDGSPPHWQHIGANTTNYQDKNTEPHLPCVQRNLSPETYDTMIRELIQCELELPIRDQILACVDLLKSKGQTGYNLCNVISHHMRSFASLSVVKRRSRWQGINMTIAEKKVPQLHPPKQPDSLESRRELLIRSQKYLTFVEEYFSKTITPEIARRLYSLCSRGGLQHAEIKALDDDLLDGFLARHPEYDKIRKSFKDWRRRSQYSTKNLLIARSNCANVTKLEYLANAATHGRPPARENDRQQFELLGIITSL